LAELCFGRGEQMRAPRMAIEALIAQKRLIALKGENMRGEGWLMEGAGAQRERLLDWVGKSNWWLRVEGSRGIAGPAIERFRVWGG